MPERAPLGLLKAQPAQELNLLAGQLYFGRQAGTVRTLLGSCVAITLWHPGKHLGGMCHFLLPNRPQNAQGPSDGRYGQDAIAWLVHAVRRSGTRPQEYRAGLYGGADTMPDKTNVKFNIGERNIELGWRLIEEHGFELYEVDVGDCVPRQVRLTLSSGEVHLRRGPAHAAPASTRPRQTA